MSYYPYNPNLGQKIQTNVTGITEDRAYLSHLIFLANAAASCVVTASTASTDILTIAGTTTVGARANSLSVNLTTNTADTLAVSADDDTGIITIALAMTTATKNTAALIQTAIRALTTVSNIDVSSFTCTAGGNWDTAAVATGETAAVDFTGGVSASEAAVAAGVHAAITCTTPYVAATCVVEAASAETDILTTSALPATLGTTGNTLSINLTTAEDDNLAVSADDETGIITVALADTTAAKNTAALIQAAIRALAEVADVDVSAFTCVAGGNWDTAAIATGETAAVAFTGGQDEAPDVATTGIIQLGTPRNITATAGGTAGDIGDGQAIVIGTNVDDEVITETLPAFTENTAGIVTGSKIFKTVTSVSAPAHDGTGATTAFGFGDKLSIPYTLSRNTVLAAYLNNSLEGTAPTVSTSATLIESNYVDLNSALNGTQVDVYLMV